MTNQLQCIRHNWMIPLVRKDGHIYYEWANEVRSISFGVKLRKLHRHFGHSSARKLYEVLKRADGGTLSEGTLSTLQKIVSIYETCNEFANRSINFQVRAPDKVVFNHPLMLHVMYLSTNTKSQEPELHIIVFGTRFNTTMFLEKMDATSVRNEFICCWATVYLGIPTSMLVDQGSIFLSDK